jgi:hypothetical protein
MDAAIWGFIGTVVGALASIGTSWLSNLNTYKIESLKEKADSNERAHSFQRETLLDLQEALHEWIRLITRAYFEDLQAFTISKEWGKNCLSEDVDEKSMLAQRKVSILIERLSDDTLRDSMKVLIKSASVILYANSREVAEQELRALTSRFIMIQSELGTVLRSHY